MTRGVAETRVFTYKAINRKPKASYPQMTQMTQISKPRAEIRSQDVGVLDLCCLISAVCLLISNLCNLRNLRITLKTKAE